MRKNHIMELLSCVGIAVMLLLGCGCASKELIRSSLRPPPEASTDHHTIIAQQYVKVTVADNFVKKYDAGGQYIVYPGDWEAIMDELDSLNETIHELQASNTDPPE